MTSSESLGGKHVFVIGGASGIGLRTAMLAADMGAEITVGGNDRDRLASTEYLDHTHPHR